jgi:hypothetical protein
LRTWSPLALLVGWVIVETARRSVVDATVTLITVPPVPHAGVTRPRAELGIGDSDETRSWPTQTKPMLLPGAFGRTVVRPCGS